MVQRKNTAKKILVSLLSTSLAMGMLTGCKNGLSDDKP